MKEKIENVIIDFDENLFKSKYYRKHFNYKNKKITELQFGGDWRILLEILVIDNEIILLNIGSHSSLELTSKKQIKI